MFESRVKLNRAAGEMGLGRGRVRNPHTREAGGPDARRRATGNGGRGGEGGEPCRRVS